MSEFKRPQRIGIDSDSSLICPGCGNMCLHHSAVEVFQREQDAEKGYHVKISDEGVAVDDNAAKGNPSVRRSGLSVSFWCEFCECKPVLGIVQHKGATYLDWIRF